MGADILNLEMFDECPYPIITSPKQMDATTNPKIIDFNSTPTIKGPQLNKTTSNIANQNSSSQKKSQ